MDDLRVLLVEIVEKGVFPIIDEFCKGWQTPFEIDDRAWTEIKARISEWLHDPKRMFDGHGIYQKGTADCFTMSSLGLFDVTFKELLKSFVEKVVFPLVDDYVRETRRVLEWDDKVWEVLKPRILEYLSKVEFQQTTTYSFTAG